MSRTDCGSFLEAAWWQHEWRQGRSLALSTHTGRVKERGEGRWQRSWNIRVSERVSCRLRHLQTTAAVQRWPSGSLGEQQGQDARPPSLGLHVDSLNCSFLLSICKQACPLDILWQKLLAATVLAGSICACNLPWCCQPGAVKECDLASALIMACLAVV